jgi:hypothetical protein
MVGATVANLRQSICVYRSIPKFIQTEMKVQAKIIRDELSKKLHRVNNRPRDNEKHLKFPLQHLNDKSTVLYVVHSVH